MIRRSKQDCLLRTLLQRATPFEKQCQFQPTLGLNVLETLRLPARYSFLENHIASLQPMNANLPMNVTSEGNMLNTNQCE